MAFKRPTTTDVPDEFFDYWLPRLSLCEMRVLLYVVRRTFGFKKDVDAISFDQFMNGIKTRDGRVLDEGCGIKNKTSLSKALKSLIQKDLLRRKQRLTLLQDQDVCLYALAVEGDVMDLEALYDDGQRGGTKNVPPWSSERTTGGTTNVPPVVRETYPQQDSSTTDSKTRKRTSCADKPRRAPISLKAVSTEDDEQASDARRLALGFCRRVFGWQTINPKNLTRYESYFVEALAQGKSVLDCKRFTRYVASNGYWTKDNAQTFNDAQFAKEWDAWEGAGEPEEKAKRQRDKTPAHVQREHSYARPVVAYEDAPTKACCDAPACVDWHAYDCPSRADEAQLAGVTA